MMKTSCERLSCWWTIASTTRNLIYLDIQWISMVFIFSCAPIYLGPTGAPVFIHLGPSDSCGVYVCLCHIGPLAFSYIFVLSRALRTHPVHQAKYDWYQAGGILRPVQLLESKSVEPTNSIHSSSTPSTFRSDGEMRGGVELLQLAVGFCIQRGLLWLDLVGPCWSHQVAVIKTKCQNGCHPVLGIGFGIPRDPTEGFTSFPRVLLCI